MNGHAQDNGDDRSETTPHRAGSESPLSDVNELPTVSAAQSDDHPQQDPSDDDAIHDMATSELEEEDGDDDEQDANFDEETPPPEAANGMRHDGSSSEEDVRSGKRKATVDDDQFMKQNPELYGLRRSVRRVLPVTSHSLADCSTQGRARPSRRVVRALFCISRSDLADNITAREQR